MDTFIQNQNEPNRKMKFGLDLGFDPIIYTSGSYIFRTEKLEPNEKLNHN
ncbi:hypothetical protein YC2023_029416 [Brassica napus]